MYSWIYILVCFVIVGVCIKPMGIYMARVYRGHAVWLQTYLGWLEHGIYRLCGIDPKEETGWIGYVLATLMLGVFGFLLLFFILVTQDILPFNPDHKQALSPGLAFNVAISFITNTNWQSYSGEIALSYFSQSIGLVVQHFFSAAAGMTVAVALFRALSRKQTHFLGNPYVDTVRGILYILLPLALIFSVVLVALGVVQNVDAYTAYTPLQAQADTQVLMAQGPVASHTAIKILGSNGGGFFNTNSAHPFANPTPLSNLLQTVMILLLPAAFVYTFGVMVGDRRQGWALIAAMTIIFIPFMLLAVISEETPNPRFEPRVMDVSAGNMEGKEMRFGAAASALWATVTSATSNGSVNSMHDSFMPLGGLVPLMLIQFGEVIFGGVGSGTYGKLMFVFFTVFIAGLMVGRTPEYLGKKLGPYEIKMASLFMLVPAATVLIGSAIAVSTEAGRAAVFNPGAQGFSEILYAFASAGNNNGSAFAGLSADNPFYNIALGVAMFIGRYWVIIPVLAIAGSLATKNTVPTSIGTLPTHTPLFVVMLVMTVVMVGVLTYVPSLALGPITEHLQLFHATGAAAP